MPEVAQYLMQFALSLAIGLPVIAVLHWWERRQLDRRVKLAVEAMVASELTKRHEAIDGN